MTSTDRTAGAAHPSGADQAAIAAVPQQVVAAWAAHDADAFAELFTDDATMILPGLYCKGREQIRTHMAAAFAGPYRGTRVTGEPIDIRLLRPQVALLITEGGVVAAGESEPAADRAVRGSWLVVERDGRWQLAAYQNSPRAA